MKRNLTRSILSIDPGQATGWSVWGLPVSEPLDRIDYGVITGGTEGFIKKMSTAICGGSVDVLIFERWITSGDVVAPDLEAVRIEGALMALLASMHPVLRPELVMRDRRDKRQVRDAVLKQAGLWITGKPAGWEDGRDINDTSIHALGWAKDFHLPTVAHYWPDR